jgi:tetratricopeptide (TPR) repeat protein
VRLSNIVLAAALAAAVAGCSSGKPGRKPKKPGADRAKANRHAMDLNIRGNNYRDLMEYDSALACYRAALEVGEQHGLGKRTAASLMMMGTVYTDRAHREPGHCAPADMDSAKDCFDRAYRIYSDSGWQTHLPGLFEEMAQVYWRYTDYIGVAESLFLQARRLARDMNLVHDEGLVLFHYGQLYAQVSFAVGDSSSLKTAAALLDTAALLLHKAEDPRVAGAAEAISGDISEIMDKLRGVRRTNKRE